MTDNPSDPQDKKIIIDEDWKGQVEAEREALKRQTEQPDDATPQDASTQDAEPPSGEQHDHGPMPPASLDYVVSTFAMQAMMAMGAIVNPVTNKSEVNLEYAKHAINTIEVLQAKTEGNRTPEESTMMDNVLHELRMAFIAGQQQGGPPAS